MTHNSRQSQHVSMAKTLTDWCTREIQAAHSVLEAMALRFLGLGYRGYKEEFMERKMETTRSFGV